MQTLGLCYRLITLVSQLKGKLTVRTKADNPLDAHNSSQYHTAASGYQPDN